MIGIHVAQNPEKDRVQTNGIGLQWNIIDRPGFFSHPTIVKELLIAQPGSR